MGFLNRFTHKQGVDTSADAARKQFYKEWERQRARAISPSDLAEIDSVFSRGDRTRS